MSEIAKLLETLSATLLSDANYMPVSLTESLDPGTANEKPVRLNGSTRFNPYDYAPAGTCSLEKFYEVAEEVIKFGQTLNSNDRSKDIELIAEYPAGDFSSFNEGEVITYKVIRREPAKMDAEGTGRVQRQSLFQRNISTSEFPNKVLSLKVRPLDHVVEFAVWSKNANLANQRALWLERLFVDHTWAFKIAGVDRFFFEGRSSDNYRTTAGQPIYERCLRFKVRLIEVNIDIDPEIKNINIVGGISNNE